MTTIKKKTTTRKNTKKEQEPTPWHKIMWVRALGFITVLGAILTVLDTSTSLFDKFYKPTPKEIVVDGSPIVAHYSKKSSTSIKERVPYTFRIQTYRVDYIETDSIKMLDIKIENKRVVNMDSITTRSVQFYPGSGSGSSIEGETAWHEIEDIFNIYLTL